MRVARSLFNRQRRVAWRKPATVIGGDIDRPVSQAWLARRIGAAARTGPAVPEARWKALNGVASRRRK